MRRQKQIEVAIGVEIDEVQSAQPPFGMRRVMPGQCLRHTALAGNVVECRGSRSLASAGVALSVDAVKRMVITRNPIIG